MRTAKLSPSQVDAFFETGFTVARGVFDADEVATILQAFRRLESRARQLGSTTMHEGSQFVVDAEDDHLSIQRVVWCGGAEGVLSEIGRDPRLVAKACQLLEAAAVEQLINQAHFKFPGDRVEFEWHQDSKHRRYGTDLWTDVNGWGSFVETATAVDPMTSENGPLQFIPGSNNLGHIPPDPETGLLPERCFDPTDAVTLTLEPGDVALFGPFVIHGSGPNESDQPRRLFLNGFAHPDANHRQYPGVDAGRRLPCPS